MDNLIAEGKSVPFIIVMENGSINLGGMPRGPRPAGAPRPGAGQPNAAPPAPGNGPRMGGPGGGMNFAAEFEKILFNDLIPFVESNFRVVGDQAHRAMAGLSMGGMQTHSIVVANPDKFAYVGMDLFKDELVDVIIPFVNKSYRIANDREHRAIAGLSMGGGTLFRIGMLNPDKFAWVGAFSSSAFRGTNGNIFDAEKQIPGILTNPEKFNKQLKLLYISSGEQDHSYEYTKKTIETFKEKGLKLQYNYFPGAHEWHGASPLPTIFSVL